MRKTVKWTVLSLLLIFTLAQLHRPARRNPPVEESHTMEHQLQVPSQVGTILDRSCNDCHSNKTTWPWYSNVAPVSWFVTDHVNHGRRHLNFSEWSGYNRRQTDNLLDAICEWVEKDRMPLDSYTAIHRNAVLSPEDKRTLCEWSRGERARLAREVSR